MNIMQDLRGRFFLKKCCNSKAAQLFKIGCSIQAFTISEIMIEQPEY